MNNSDHIKKLYVFNTGLLLNSKNLNLNIVSSMSLPVFAYLIIHEDHLVLFDSGLSIKLAENPERYLGKILDTFVPFRTKSNWVLSHQLSNKIKIKNIDTVLLSHRHLDHTGEVFQFPQAEVYITKEEMKNKNTILGSLRGIKVSDLNSSTKIKHPKFSKIKNPWGLHRMMDVFGDKSIFFAHTPGHVLGHSSLVLNTEPPVFLAGDALYCSPQQYQNPKVKQEWDLLSVVYYFRKKGIALTSHDFLHRNLLNSEFIEVFDPVGNAFSRSDDSSIDLDAVI